MSSVYLSGIGLSITLAATQLTVGLVLISWALRDVARAIREGRDRP